MPNLVGIWDLERSEDSIRATLGRQLQQVRVPGISYREYSLVSRTFGMALQDHGILENGVQPARSDDGRFALLLDGELYNADGLKERFRQVLPERELSTPGLCLRLILQK